MDSLYGGKPGVSFVLKAAFRSISDMAAAFKQGQNYTAVWYGEFVVIDTINKNHKDNGKIYRRGLDYQNDLGGAEYIGQIVGPSSGTPYFQLDYLDPVKDAAKIEANGEDVWKKYPTGRDENGKYTIVENGSGEDLGIFEFNRTNALIPGKNNDGSYNDSIRYTWVNIREDNADADSWFYVGIQLPYLVIDYKVHSVNPYDELGNRADVSTIERVDDLTHPFWEEWDLGLVKGIKGDTLRNLKIITPTATDTIYTIDQIQVDVNPDTGNFHTTLGIPGYPGQQEDIDNQYQILVYEHVYYDNIDKGESVLIYLGDYKLIRAIRVDDEGTLYLDLTHDGTTQFTKKIRWIKLINLTTGIGTKGGHFTFTYNNDNPRETDEFYVSWIRCIEVEDDGSLVYTFAGTTEDIPEGAVQLSDGVYKVEEFIKWVNEVELDPNTGKFTMSFNHGADLVRQLDWIDNLYIDEPSGEIAVHHVDAAKDTGVAKNGKAAEILKAKLKLIIAANISDKGVVTFITNTGEKIELMMTTNTGEQEQFKLKYIKDVRLLKGINDDKHIQVQYNTDDEYVKIGNPINDIKDMVVRSSDWHLLVLYSDPTHRATAEILDSNNQDAQGHKWVANVTGSDGTEYFGVYWRDLGPIKDQSGVLIGFNFTDEDIAARAAMPGKDNIDTPLEYLNDRFPDGLVDGIANTEYGRSLNGKIATYTPTGSDDVEFYAFDYGNHYEWYYLGTLTDSGKRDARMISDQITGTEYREIVTSINTNGILVYYWTPELSTTPIPDYWERTYDKWI